jgi:catechol 2,3-dioxygenase
VNDSIPAGTRIGHVHLKVSDLGKSEAFYRDILGYEVTMRGPGLVFMSAGGYHHHLALNSTMSEGVDPPPDESPGLLHFAVLFPTFDDFIAAGRRALDGGVTFHRASDYGYSLALYMKDPDGIEIELSWDRDPSAWYRNADGSLRRDPKRLSPEEVFAMHQPTAPTSS